MTNVSAEPQTSSETVTVLTVRLGDAVIEGRASCPVLRDGEIVHFFVAFMSPSPTDMETFREAVRDVLLRARVRVGIQDLLRDQERAGYDLPTFAPGIMSLPEFPKPMSISRGEALTFSVHLEGDAPPPCPVLMRVVFEIAAAPPPTLH